MAKVTLTRPNVYQLCGVTLIAGDNKVSSADLAKLEKQSGFQRDVERGVIVIDKPKRGRPAKVEQEKTQEPEPFYQSEG